MHQMEVGKMISSNWKGHEQPSPNQKANKESWKLHAAKLETLKKGVFTSYKPSVFEERQKQAREEVSAMNS